MSESDSLSPVEWKVTPLSSRPMAVVVIWFAAILVALVGGLGMAKPLLGLAGFVMILGSTAEYWLGKRFRVDETGVRSQVGLSVTAMEWAEVKRVLRQGNLIHLSPLVKPSRMDAFRGVVLRTTPEVIEEVERWIDSKAPVLDASTVAAEDVRTTGD